MNNIEIFKPFVKELIQWYYESLPDNRCGGNLHIVLDDGNIEHHFIEWCKEECLKAGDTFGMFLSDVLLLFTEDELLEMYDKDWWGMN